MRGLEHLIMRIISKLASYEDDECASIDQIEIWIVKKLHYSERRFDENLCYLMDCGYIYEPVFGKLRVT